MVDLIRSLYEPYFTSLQRKIIIMRDISDCIGKHELNNYQRKNLY
ncbi:MAG: hypothetical protein ABIH55_04550 [Nanoarchaeota archaeon]